MYTYIVVSYVVLLRDSEGFLLDLEGLRDYWGHDEIDDSFGKFIYICLRGQVKGESGACCHVLPCVPKIMTGIYVKSSIRRLIKLKSKQGPTSWLSVFKIWCVRKLRSKAPHHGCLFLKFGASEN